MVVADSKRAAISYLKTYLADDVEIKSISEMDDGTIIALDALDSEDIPGDDTERWKESETMFGEVYTDDDEFEDDDWDDEEDEDEEDDEDDDDYDDEDDDDDLDEDEEDEDEEED